jgi:3-deoxy-D-manno-octulosonic-acid transferase
LLPLAALLPRWRKGLGMRLGILPREVRTQAWLSEGSLWVHAASLGEVNAIAPVVRELLPKLPRQALIFTCTTTAGREQAQRLFPQAAACLLMPIDLPWVLAAWFRRFKPRLLVVAETELWPNLLRQAKLHGAQVLLANGRLTERSLKRYRLLGRAFAGVLEQVDLFAMQAEADAERLAQLGARRARLVVTGNTKFDLAGDVQAAKQAAGALRHSLGWKAGTPVIVAGSTRPGEEAGLLEAFRAVQKSSPAARLVLAPRHLERCDEVAALLKKGRWKAARRSQNGAVGDADVLLLDTLGELRSFYALACEGGAAWVGGSFKDFGGQNPLEPAALGVPVFFGPSMRHFPEVAQALLEAGAAQQVDAAGLAVATLALLEVPKERRRRAEAAEACVSLRAGASQRNAELGLRLLLVARLRREGQLWREEGLDSFRSIVEFGSASETPDWHPDAPVQYLGGKEFGMGLEKDPDGLG